MKKNSAFTLRSGNRPSIAKLAGVSPAKNLIGPKNIMIDKDKDKISDFIDADAGSGKSNKKTQDSVQPKKVKTKDQIKKEKQKTSLDRIKKVTKKVVKEGTEEFTKTVRPKTTNPTRGEVISAFANPFDIKSKIKTVKHYLPKIKKYLDTPVQKKR
tara:strand:- start:158 stop:625 length:468 start_codon:yes stop_codon:yes gene_type:complete